MSERSERQIGSRPWQVITGRRPAMTMPFYVSPEQLMKDRADFARKGIGRGRGLVVVQYADGVAASSRRTLRSLHKISEIYDRVALRRGRPLQRVREPADRRRPAGRHARLRLRPARRHRPRAGQRLRADPGHDLLQRRREALRGGDLRRRGRATTADGRPDLPADLRRPGGRRARVRRHGRRRRSRSRRTSPSTSRRGLALAEALAAGGRRAGPRRRDRRPADPGRRPRGRGARPHPHPAAQVPPADAAGFRATCSARTRSRPRTAGRGLHQPPADDDPADPTDTASSVPPLENPVTGEPTTGGPGGRGGPADPVAPDDAPIAPPVDPDDPLA